MTKKKLSFLGGLAVTALLITGCLLSGTFVIDESFNFTSGSSGFYYYPIDITSNSDWEDHKNDIDNIDLVGFELWMHNSGETDLVFDAYADAGGNPLCTDKACLDANSTKSLIISNLTVGPGDRHITYAESFKYLKNLDRLKALAKTGKLNIYATASGNGVLTVDSGKVVVTFSASTGGI